MLEFRRYELARADYMVIENGAFIGALFKLETRTLPWTADASLAFRLMAVSDEPLFWKTLEGSEGAIACVRRILDA